MTTKVRVQHLDNNFNVVARLMNVGASGSPDSVADQKALAKGDEAEFWVHGSQYVTVREEAAEAVFVTPGGVATGQAGPGGSGTNNKPK